MKITASTKVFIAGMILLAIVSVAAIPQANRKAALVQREFQSIPVPSDTESINIRENHKPGAAYRAATLTSGKRSGELWEFYKGELRNLGWFLCEQKSVERRGEKFWIARYCKGDLEANVELPAEPYPVGKISYSVSVRWAWRIP